MNRIPARLATMAIFLLALLAGSSASRAQGGRQGQQATAPSARELELNQHLDELTNRLESMRQQLMESETEMDELRRELHSVREQLAERSESDTAARDAESLRASVAQLKDDSEVLKAEVKQHDQSKVESSSKYPLRIHGALLATSILNMGSADDYNLPIVAVPRTANSPSGSLSESASQSMLGLDASGPRWMGAKSYADLNVDFWGGVSSNGYTPAGGNVRLRTAHARLEWPHRSLGVALDRPLLSPWQPASWITVAEPALAWSGNLWTWSPQVEFRQERLLKHWSVEAGLIDPPTPENYTATPSGQPSASERSRQPGYESRIGFASSWSDHPINLGASGYYSRQAYPYGRHVDAWAGAADWDFSPIHALQVSGQFYRGRAIGGLGGGAFKDYVSNATSGYFAGVSAAGGWAQAKFTILPSLEANVSTGLDDAYASDLRGSDEAVSQSYYASLARNQTVLANLMFRPKTYLLFSTEFRQINSRSATGQTSQDRVAGIATGYIF